MAAGRLLAEVNRIADEEIAAVKETLALLETAKIEADRRWNQLAQKTTQIATLTRSAYRQDVRRAETMAASIGPLGQLTAREHEVYRLLVGPEMLQRKEIARRLNMSVSTVRYHTRRIADKLGCGPSDGVGRSGRLRMAILVGPVARGGSPTSLTA